MALKDDLKELAARRSHVLMMGGKKKIEKQRKKGKATVRERLDLLFDAGTFTEIGQLTSHLGDHGVAQKVEETSPADAVVTGFGEVGGRSIFAVAEDFTVKGGTSGIIHLRKKLAAIEMARREKIPVIWLLDGAGARAQEMIGEGLPYGRQYLEIARHSGTSVQVAIVMGPSAGDSSLIASLCEFIIMVDKTSMLAAGGPPIVKAATGRTITKEELGGPDVHCIISGVADNRASSEKDAIKKAQKFLSYLPTNAFSWPPDTKPIAPLKGSEEELLSIIPANPRAPFDMKRIIELIIDANSFFEIKPEYAKNIITGFARFEGQSVGIIANQSLHQAGAITVEAANKARHFIDLCSSYHIPLVFLQDVPGVMPGAEAERAGTLRPGLALTYSLAWSNVPKITVVIRKSFGYGSVAMCGGGAGQVLTLAWPSADFGSLPPSSAILAAHSAELDAAKDRNKLEKELMENYQRSSGAFQAAATFSLDDVIYPQETRSRICTALKLARNRRDKPPEPVLRAGVMP